jgi:hypothetical protein
VSTAIAPPAIEDMELGSIDLATAFLMRRSMLKYTFWSQWVLQTPGFEGQRKC